MLGCESHLGVNYFQLEGMYIEETSWVLCSGHVHLFLHGWASGSISIGWGIIARRYLVSDAGIYLELTSRKHRIRIHGV